MSAGILVFLLSGCVIPIHKRYERSVSLSRAFASITKGQTTRADIVQLLGPPDIEAVGGNATVNPQSPLALYYREFMKHFKTPESEWLALLPYSSLGDDRLALLFTELDATVVVVVAPVTGGTGSGRWNRLLVLVDKKTGRVTDVYLGQEFRRE